jgi:hypothetical protein
MSNGGRLLVFTSGTQKGHPSQDGLNAFAQR